MSPTPLPAHNNRLIQCFDEIMKVAAEMMVQQQLKTVQLDASVINGFSEAQQRVLSEKVHMFHSILDDLETTLSKSKSYVGAIYEIGVERVKRREQERIDLRRKQEEEEERRNKELEELVRRQSSEQRLGESRQQQVDVDDKIGFPIETPNGLLPNLGENGRNMNGSPAIAMAAQSHVAMTPVESRQQSPKPSQGRSSRGEDMGDMGGMDISMFPGLDNSGFDMGTFGIGMNDNGKNADKGPNVMTNFEKPPNGTDNNSSENPGSASMADNGDNYLTLNDFNDLNIDWTANGDSGDLDLNGFNI